MPRSPTDDVDAFLAALPPAQQACVRRLRAVILAADPRIGEAIKWNAPSFHVEGRHFATMQLRRADRMLLVLHLGAGKRALPDGAIADPQRQLAWLGADRATWSFVDREDVEARAAGLQDLLRQWMAHL
ncbi:MAG: DUF1801 domain-containing protein [Stenotrophomonas acidaminiphila]|jgi:hypothetical protein|nr:MAG: DUF1801 domain-containing protein [Stenotrophomonas acidaminiphila]